MMTTETISPPELDDAALVTHTLSGSREAFGQIVGRYQSLICALAYSATGSLSQSEDVAQETFLTAWKELPFLREPAKLRPWLCGIARNVTRRVRRGQAHEPAHGAEQLETSEELPALDASPLDRAITREEEAILWRSLERIPEDYREPLILFYREGHSVEKVARIMDMSQEAVRQRLVRGRRLLHERVVAFVQGTLEKTSPGRNFTLSVLSALPPAAAKGAFGATLSTGSAVAKVAASVAPGALWALAGGSGIVALRAQADDTKSPRERRFMFMEAGTRYLLAILLINAIFYGGSKLEQSGYVHGPLGRGLLDGGIILVVFAIGTCAYGYNRRRQRTIQMEDGTYVEAEWKLPRSETDSTANSPGSKSNANLRTLKLMAVSLSVTVIILVQAPWREYPVLCGLFAAIFALTKFMRFRSYRNRPRFECPRNSTFVWAAMLTGSLCLLFYTLHQFGWEVGAVKPGFSPAEMIAFILLLIVGYTGRLALCAWKRRGNAAGGTE
jgi:RNA polymerase sigma factor (sigma-70 family)